jgi:hypothetical protein
MTRYRLGHSRASGADLGDQAVPKWYWRTRNTCTAGSRTMTVSSAGRVTGAAPTGPVRPADSAARSVVGVTEATVPAPLA